MKFFEKRKKKKLEEGLEGYTEYKSKVKYKVIFFDISVREERV